MPSFEQLTHNLTDTSQPIATRRAAVIEIGNIGGAQALPFLLKALSDVAPGVRREAANALQKCDFPEATDALIEALKKDDSDLTRWTLIEVLGNIGTVSALPMLESLLSTEVSPLTRKEVQKSISLITTRYPDTDTVETTSESSEHFHIPTDTPDFSESTALEVEQPELSQGTTSENIVVADDYPDDLSSNSDELITADTSDSSSDVGDRIPSGDVEDRIPTGDVETPIIDLTTAEGPQTSDMTSEESSDTVASSQDSIIDIEDETDLRSNAVSNVQTLARHGSTSALPVLVPNTSVVIYEEEDRKFEPGVFAIMLRPKTYLSKQWISRTRLYLVLFCLLVAATATLVYSQVQRRPRPPYLPSTKIAFVENPQHYLDAGNFFIQQMDYRSAIEMYELIRGIESMDPVLYKNLAFAHFQENQYALAVEAYEFYLQARKTKPYLPFVAEASFTYSNGEHDMENWSDYKTYNTLGTAYKRLGHFHKARLAYETAIKIAPNEAAAYNNLAQLYSDGYQQKHLLTEALAYAAVRLNPDVASYHDTLGRILGKSRRLNKATDEFEQAIRLQSDYVPAYYHLTEIARKSNKEEKIVQNALIKNTRRKKKLRQSILSVLSYIYETDSQKIPRFSTSFLQLRGVKE